MALTTPILSENHYSLNIIEDIKAICEPFFKSHDIKHFTYVRCYNDGSMTCFITHRELYIHHFNKEYLVSPMIPSSIISKKFHYFAMPDLDDGFSQTVFDYNSFFGINYPIYLYERHENYFDLFIYAYINNTSNAINFFLNNFDILENFKFYFKDKARNLMGKSEKNKIVLPKHMKANFGGLGNTAYTEENISKTIAPKRYTINGAHGEIYLSARELDTIKYLAKGFTAKQAAKETGLSPRTIESYLQNIKHKLGVNRKNEAIKIVSDFGLL